MRPDSSPQPTRPDEEAGQPAALPYLIVGLGNPGRQYRFNRHNIGFMLADRLAEQMGISFRRVQARALVTDGRFAGRKVILAKPITFMNESGVAVGALARFFKLLRTNLLVAHDDLDLPLGSLRLRPEGGSGGHKGMRSVIEHLGAEDFARLRLGIGRPPGRMDPADYVLQDFSKMEEELRDEMLARGVEAVLSVLTQGMGQAMTDFNREPA